MDVTVSDNWWPQSGVNHINIPVWCYGAHPQHLSETETSFTISNTSPACPLLLLTIDIVTMCILCRGELCNHWNIYLCTHIGIIGKFKWWLIKSTRTKKNIFLCSLRKMQEARPLHQHMQKNKNKFSTFLGHKCLRFLFSGQWKLITISSSWWWNWKFSIFDQVSSRLVTVAGSPVSTLLKNDRRVMWNFGHRHAKMETFAIWCHCNKPWTCRVWAWQCVIIKNISTKIRCQYWCHFYVFLFYCICTECYEADYQVLFYVNISHSLKIFLSECEMVATCPPGTCYILGM